MDSTDSSPRRLLIREQKTVERIASHSSYTITIQDFGVQDGGV
jgi:hypothetical protein